VKRRYGEIHVRVWTAAGSSKFTSILGIKGAEYKRMKDREREREKVKVRKLQEQLINV
jgi:hypothetical protein